MRVLDRLLYKFLFDIWWCVPRWIAGARRRRHGSASSNNQSEALKDEVNMESLLEEKMPEFDHMTPTSSVYNL